MNVLVLTPYSHPSQCGIWKRAWDDIVALKEDYTIQVYSSNILKGTGQKLPKEEEYKGVKITRFRSWFSFGLNSLFFFHFWKLWKNRKEIDIIHTHGYRHPHSIQALIVGKLTKKKVLITPHAPFEKDPRRSTVIKIFDVLYDILIGWWEMMLYDRVISTTKWEQWYLKRQGATEKKIEYIPNGIDPYFLEKHSEIDADENSKSQSFHDSIRVAENSDSEDTSLDSEQKDGTKVSGERILKILFMGRLDPVKRLEWIQYAARQLPEHSFKIHGPMSGYDEFESNNENLKVVKKSYTKEKFVEEAKKADIFLSTSIRESFGMTTLEAMSQGCIVISAKTRGAEEYLKDKENGFLVEDEDEIVEKISYISENFKEMERIKEKAIETARSYNVEFSRKKLALLYTML